MQAEKGGFYHQKNPNIKNAWEIHIERGLELDFSKRNESLVKLIARCFHRFSNDQILFLAEAFHEIYKPFFKDSADQHMVEAEAMLKSVQNSYLKDFPEEQAMYQSLPGDIQSIYRICRDLAQNEKKIPKPFFALSGNELGKRLGTTRSIAGTLLTQLASILIIQIQEKGEAWTAGKKR